MVTPREVQAASDGYQVVAIRDQQYDAILQRLAKLEAAVLELKDLLVAIAEKPN